MWPEPTLLRDKLCGNLEELRRTAALVRATGIVIERTAKKKKKKKTALLSRDEKKGLQPVCLTRNDIWVPSMFYYKSISKEASDKPTDYGK